MNDTAASPAAVHPFLDGKPKRMLVGGKWLEAASGKLRSNAGARCAASAVGPTAPRSAGRRHRP